MRAQHQLPSHLHAGYKGTRVLGAYMAYFLKHAVTSRSKRRSWRVYRPHQGAKECARRVQQLCRGMHGGMPHEYELDKRLCRYCGVHEYLVVDGFAVTHCRLRAMALSDAARKVVEA